MDTIRKLIYAGAAGVIFGCFVGAFVRGRLIKPRVAETVRIEYRDTSYSRRDLSKPMELKTSPVAKVPQFIFIPQTETKTIVKDSIRYVMLEREHRFLSKDNVDIWYSGIDPSIDSLRVKYAATHYTNVQAQTKAKWAFNVYGGLDVGRTGTGHYASPNIGVELNYNRWSFGCSGGFDMNLQQQTQLMPFVEVNLKYNILSIGR